MLPDLILSPMRRVFFGVGATLYSFTLSQSFWQVTRRSRLVRKSLPLPTIHGMEVVLMLIVQHLAVETAATQAKPASAGSNTINFPLARAHSG